MAHTIKKISGLGFEAAKTVEVQTQNLEKLEKKRAQSRKSYKFDSKLLVGGLDLNLTAFRIVYIRFIPTNL